MVIRNDPMYLSFCEKYIARAAVAPAINAAVIVVELAAINAMKKVSIKSMVIMLVLRFLLLFKAIVL